MAEALREEVTSRAIISSSSSSSREKINSGSASDGQEKNKQSLSKKLELYIEVIGLKNSDGIVNHDVVKLRMATLDFWEEFGHWLLYEAVTRSGSGNEPYAISSILNFLGYAHNDVALGTYYSEKVTTEEEKAVRRWLYGTDGHGEGLWYYRLRSKLEELHFVRNVENGESVSGKSASAGRNVVVSMCKHLLRSENNKTGVLRRYAVTSSRMFAGRTGRVMRNVI